MSPWVRPWVTIVIAFTASKDPLVTLDDKGFRGDSLSLAEGVMFGHRALRVVAS